MSIQDESLSNIEPRRSPPARVVVALLVVIGVVWGGLHWRSELPALVARLTASDWGPIAATAIFIPAVLVTAPVSWLTVLMGYAFGFARGMAIGSCGGLLGASAAFVVSRYLLRDMVRRWWSSTHLFRALERELGSRGIRLIVLARISPLVSCSLLSYLCGATRIGYGRFVVATWLGMAPGSVVYAWIGSSVREWTEADQSVAAHPYARVLWFVGLLATVAVVAQLTRTARKLLREQLDEAG